MESRSLSRSSSKSDLGLPRSNTAQRAPSSPQERWGELKKVRPNLPEPNRGKFRERKPAKPPEPLSRQDCGDEWKMMIFYLDNVAGLTLPPPYTSFVAASRLGEEVAKPLAIAINYLMQKGLVPAARKLMDMCKASALPSLLSRCSPDHVEKLTGHTGKGGEGSEDAMSAKVRTFMRTGNLSGAYKFLSLCSADTSANLSGLLPPLDEEMVRALDIDALVDALHVTLVRIRPADEAARRNELTSLLSIADRVDPARMVAMKCVIGLSDSPQELRDLALLPQLSLELFQAVPRSLQADVLQLAVQQAPEQRRSLLELALKSDNLTTAASLMHDSPDPEPPPKLFGAVLKKLESAGFKVGQRPLTFDIKDLGPANPKTEAAEKEQRTLTAQKMAIVLLMTGEPYHAEAALAIISKIDAEPVQQRAFIRELVEGLGFEGENLSEALVNALPRLCSDDLLLEIVLATREGQHLLAKAVPDYLSSDQCSGDTVALMFEKLAPRVSILHVLPDIQSTLMWDVDGKFNGIRPGQPLTKMIAMAKGLKIDKLIPFEPSPRWAPGWRSLGLIILDHRQGKPDEIVHDPYRLLAAKLIDATATQSDDVLKLMEFMDFKPQEILADMIANGLLSGNALRNFVLSMMSSPGLLSHTLAAIDGLGAPDLQRLAFTEVVRALIALPKERSDEAGAKSAAQAVYKSAVFDQVMKEIDAIDKEAWPQFLSRFPGA